MRRLHPATIVVAILPRLREAVQTALPVLIGSFVAGHKADHDWIAGFVALFTGVFAIGGYWTSRYDIETDHVVHTTGWIFRKDRRIPLIQIQNVSLRQNLLERLFRVATVDVETAGGHGHDLKLSVLGLADAERFREELLGAAHLDGGGAKQVEEPIVRLSQHDLIYGAITENHFRHVVVVLFTIVGPGMGVIMPLAEKLHPAARASVFGGGLLLLTVGAWIWGAISYVLKYGGFTVQRSDTVFKISYGLLNRAQMAIRPGRIEFLRITVTLLQRWMERATFEVGTAATFGEAGVLAPVALFVPWSIAFASAAEVIPGLSIPSLDWRPFHRVFYMAAVVRSMIWIVVAAMIEWGIVRVAPTEVSFVAGIILGLVVASSLLRTAGLLLSSPENGFAITENALITRRGYLHQVISAIPIERIENIRITQPFWWRRFGVARLTVQGMKHRVFVGAISEEAVEILQDTWGEKISSVDVITLYSATLSVLPDATEVIA